jgi:hypothetical protein
MDVSFQEAIPKGGTRPGAVGHKKSKLRIHKQTLKPYHLDRGVVHERHWYDQVDLSA